MDAKKVLTTKPALCSMTFYARSLQYRPTFRWVLLCVFQASQPRLRAKHGGIHQRVATLRGLYIRLSVSFFSHPKTIRLYRIIGADAFWLPQRIWAYAAEYQPDGDFSDYDIQELAMILGYKEDASSMLQALQSAKFLDGMKIHDWNEHNGYHVIFAERAKKAADARWKKERTKERSTVQRNRNRKENSKHCLSIASSNAKPMLQASEIYSAYPKKVGKPNALRAIQKALTKVPYDKLLSLTKAYADARNGDTAFCPHPSTWFNDERYNDDPSTWAHQDRERPKERAPRGAVYRTWDADAPPE